MRKFYLLLLTLCLTFSVEYAFAWGQKGHRIVAQIAYDNLTKKARKQVDKVLGECGMVYWANWADEIKSDTIYATSYDWHFQDLESGLNDSTVVAVLTDYPEIGGNLFRLLDSLTHLLQVDPNNLDALRFVVHLMGDRFCPMHTGRLGDLGGNRVKLTWFKQETNLHSVWDERIIDARGYSYKEYADYLEDAFVTQKKQIQQLSDAEILLHNYKFTQEIYQYQEQWDGNTFHYVYHFAPAMEWQLYAAGIRLAQLLNEIYG